MKMSKRLLVCIIAFTMCLCGFGIGTVTKNPKDVKAANESNAEMKGGSIKKVKGKYYYYNSKGKKVSKKGWKTISDTYKVYVSKKGYVSERIYKKGKSFFYQKWTGKKFKNNVENKNTFKKLDGKKYYFNAKGRIAKAGWYMVDDATNVKVGDHGYVTERIVSENDNWVYYAINPETEKEEQFLDVVVDTGYDVFIFYENGLGISENEEANCDNPYFPIHEIPGGENVCYKPVIYLYPETETDVTVKMDYNGKLTCTYPKISNENSWKVTAKPDGTLTDANGMEYNYLYWEGEDNIDYDMSKGYCVAGKDTAAFLEKALAELGLARKEANEFIVFWLPQMENNAYNIISFQGAVYTENAKLMVDPNPDTLIRVFMAYKSSDKKIDIEPQKFVTPERKGFTVVEWGGTNIK